MPSRGVEVKAVNALIRLHLRWVKEADRLGTTNDQHVELVDGDGGMTLSSSSALFESILHLRHLVGTGIEDFHARQHLIGITKTTVQVYLIVHV